MKPTQNRKNRESFTLEKRHKIESAVGSIYGLTIEQINSVTRKRNICDARHLVWKLIEDVHRLGRRDIGRMYKVSYTVPHANHSTIFHGISAIEDLIETDEKTRIKYNLVKEML